MAEIQNPSSFPGPGGAPPHPEGMGFSSATAMVPGGLLLRFAASIIDGIIVSIITLPITAVMGVLLAMTLPALAGGQGNLSAQLFLQIITSIPGMVAGVAYYVYFYKKKGGSLGKLALGLRVVDAKTGTHLRAGQTILRETIGKWIFIMGLMLFFLSAILAALRQDKRAWHDLMAGSQVLRKQ